MEDQVILVDENNKPIGTAGKMAAHRLGLMHRAISVFVFDASGRLLLQQRASIKYHSAGLWSNTCCSHPMPEEGTAAAAHRRLQQEMGIACALTEVFSFVYREAFSNGLIEHEYDNVFFGRYDGTPVPNPEEVDDWRWIDMERLDADLKSRPEAYSFWLAACIEKVREHSDAYRRGTACPESR